MMNYLVTVFSENYQGKEVYEQVVYNVDTPELAIECLKAMMAITGFCCWSKNTTDVTLL